MDGDRARAEYDYILSHSSGCCQLNQDFTQRKSVATFSTCAPANLALLLPAPGNPVKMMNCVGDAAS